MDFSLFEPLVAAGGVLLLALAFSLLLVSLRRKRAGNRDRLDSAFERARYTRRTGTMGSDRGYIR